MMGPPGAYVCVANATVPLEGGRSAGVVFLLLWCPTTRRAI